MKKRLVSIFLILFSLSFIYAQTSGGPDTYGYTWANSNDAAGPAYSWITPDASATVVTGQADDNMVGPYDIGFNFPFYGAYYNQFYLSSNGFISFTADSHTYNNTTIPTAGTPNGMIAWFWDDMDPVSTTAPANNAVVTYENITYNGSTALLVTFMNYHGYSGEDADYQDTQVILANNGDIIVNYAFIEPTTPQNSATIGIENADGTDGLQVSYNTADVLTDNMSIQYTRPTTVPLGGPSSPSPADGLTGVASAGNIEWLFGPGTATYDLWFGPAGSMTEVVTGAAAAGGTTGTYSYSGLAPQTTYEWQVIVYDGDTGQETSPVWSFTSACATVTTFPWTETVDSSTFPACWADAATPDPWNIGTSTPSSLTGPQSGDHTDGTGYFFYTEASGNLNQQFKLTTPVFNVSGITNPTLEFYYHMYGSSMGSLQVNILETGTSTLHTDVMAPVSGDQGDVWNGASIDLSAYSEDFVIEFVATTGTNYYSDICLDDFMVFSNASAPACLSTWSPADEATGLLEDVSLLWGNPGGATSYMLYLGTSSGNYDIVNGMVLTETSYDFTAALGNTYYWSVAPGNLVGYATGCPELSFSTRMTPPDCPASYSPADAAVDQVEFGYLMWDEAPSASEYLVYLGTASGNYDIVNGASVTNTEYFYTGLTGGSTYYWKVSPANVNGPNTSCTEMSFSVRNDVTVTGAVTVDFESGIPADWVNLTEGTSNDDEWLYKTSSIGHGATSGYNSTGYIGFDDSGTSTVDVAYILTTPFDFTAMNAPELSFMYWIGDSGDTTNDQSTLYLDIFDGSAWNTYGTGWGHTGQWTEVSVDLAAYTGATSFRFRAIGTTSFYSDVCLDDFIIFDNSTPPPCISTFAPSDGEIDLLEDITLSWGNPGATDSYLLYLGSSTGNYDIINGMSLTATSYDYTATLGNNYYWKVNPVNSNGEAQGCPEWTFATRMTPPDCSAGYYPTDADGVQYEYGQLMWNSSVSATEYLVYLGTASGTYDVVNGMTVTGTEYDYSGLAYGSTYYWMVNPVNANGPNTSCVEQNFTVRNNPLVTGAWSTDFESGIPFDWYNVEEGTDHDDDWDAETGAIGYGATSGYNSTGYMGFDDSGTSTVDVAYIVTNPFDLSGMGNPTLSFMYWIGVTGNTSAQSTLYFDIHDGSTWTEYGTNWTQNGAWAEIVIDLSAYTGVTTFRFRALGTDSYFSDICIDDFILYDAGSPPGCVNSFSPADGAGDQLTYGTLSWSSPGNTDDYMFYLGTSAGNYDIVNGMTMTATSYDYSGYDYSSTYFWKVVPGNTYGDATGCPEWSFTTMADPTITTMPWMEDFTNWIPTNWTLSGDRTWAQYGGEAAYCNFWGWNGGTAIMSTPPVQIPSTGNWALTFDWSHAYNSSYPDDQGIVQVSIDGSNWTELWNLTGTAFESNDGAGSTSPGTGVTETFPLDAYLGETVYFQIIGNSDWGPDFYFDNFGVQPYTPPTAKAMVNVYLGGPYSTENHNMDTTVNQYLPVTSPYADAIAVTAMPADVVDWISLELRQTATGATIEQRSALLLDSGMIVDVAYETDNTVDYVNFTTAAAGDYFVVVRHRNHSDIMSAAAVTLPADASTATAVDFTADTANAYTTGPNALYEVETGVYAMYPGDVNADGSIIANDATLWQDAFTAGVSDGYHAEDVDLDGSVIAGDNVEWKAQFTAGAPDSQVPANGATSAASAFKRNDNRVIRINATEQQQVRKIAK